jgi:hypothetical protein
MDDQCSQMKVNATAATANPAMSRRQSVRLRSAAPLAREIALINRELGLRPPLGQSTAFIEALENGYRDAGGFLTKHESTGRAGRIL